MIPQLRKLEHKYAQELVIVGAEAGKFRAERITANIRQAALRLGVDHPVVNDRQFRIWRAYGVNAWPTLVLINPIGHYVDTHAGEITFEGYDGVIGRMVEQFEARGRIDRTPLGLRPEREAEPERPLSFPGKVLATPDGRLFISDSGHHRILVVALEGDGASGRVEMAIGRGTPGMEDGDLLSASFDHPQGLALVGDTLFVADTENHALRAVDLAGRRVKTIAGNGKLGNYRPVRGVGAAVSLNSPWDLLWRGRTLLLAMAGTHQLWSYDLDRDEVRVYAGSGWEDLVDGPLERAALAQPMGLTTDGRHLYFADAESSAVRRIDLEDPDRVETIVGRGLFDFGDEDGVGPEALLQHPQGLAWYEGILYIADSYNNKIKALDPLTRRSVTFLGTGEAGWRDGDNPLFWEPEGVSAANGRLYVADTNNHCIRVADLRSRQVRTLRLDQ